VNVIKPILLLVVVLIPAAIVHRLVLGSLNMALTVQEYAYAYGVNFVMASIIVMALLRLPERFKASLGFFFLFGSLLKFIVYFVFFLPHFKEDGDLSKLEFFCFFVPYALCLVIETTVLIAKLKAEDKATKSTN
jgi:hypothetical protein